MTVNHFIETKIISTQALKTSFLLKKVTRYRHYWSLEDTLSGYLINQLDFCSKLGSDDFSFDSCSMNCMPDAKLSYWQAASIFFAQNAKGSVLVVLNGTRTYGAISKRSFFVNYELPQLSADRVKRVKVLLLFTPGNVYVLFFGITYWFQSFLSLSILMTRLCKI
jgi:hypothetical protein